MNMNMFMNMIYHKVSLKKLSTVPQKIVNKRFLLKYELLKDEYRLTGLKRSL